MSLVASFVVLLQPLVFVVTTPSFANLKTILAGWAFASRRTVTGMSLTAWAMGRKHHSTFHRLFAQARRLLDRLGPAIFGLIERHLVGDQIFLAIDDTFACKRGLKVFGVGMHHDPLFSTRKVSIMIWGHSWVVIARFRRWPNRVFCLQILFRIYLNHIACDRHRRTYRARPELAVEL